MNFRVDVANKVNIDGQAYTIHLVQNPTIDDVLSIEARLYAVEVETGERQEHRVERSVRDFLIKLEK